MNFLPIAISIWISWTYSPEIAEQYQVTHFTLYMGIQSVVAGNPPLRTWTLNYPVMQQQVDGLDVGTAYYFATKVWNATGSSVYSGELVFTPMLEPEPIPTPTATPTPMPTPTPGPAPTPTPPGKRKGHFK